ncbi:MULTISPECIES: hypothetical protein [unclassified Adlercreutzia]|uniref:hypothetical protein n=1 Tax=unclassified Adlercreutzia TaxID=2636013 RepID=UPI0013E9BE21|nr:MULTISPECIES: hypothetical protein [unclassified Adlercreutzia]
MIGVLLKKQVAEVWRGYFYDAKENKARSRLSTAVRFLLFALLMIVLLGGIFAALALFLCQPFADVGMGWMYFVVMGMVAVLLGAFGSIFNGYAGLYLAKDNDLLLSMPVPLGAILAARLLNVYLLGLMYSGIVCAPALIVYWAVARCDAFVMLAGLLWAFLVSMIVLVLSCALGWVVARISLKLKDKGLVAAIAAVLLLAAYWAFCGQIYAVLYDLTANAASYGTQVRESAAVLYCFGRAAEGDWPSLLAMAAVIGAAFAVVWLVLSRTFLHTVTATGAQGKAVYREKAMRRKSPARALLGKELQRLVSSANYLLNCSLGTVMLPLLGGLLLWKGGEYVELFGEVFAGMPGTASILLCVAACMLAVMNDTAVPSVSLEGANLWLVRSLPVSTWRVLQAKLRLQVALTAPPLLFCSVCAVLVLRVSLVESLLLLLVPQLFMLLLAHLGLALGLLWPNLRWTDETAPVKRSMAVILAMIAGWVCGLALAAIWLWQGWHLGAAPYLLLTAALAACACAGVRLWLKSSGCRRFEAL